MLLNWLNFRRNRLVDSETGASGNLQGDAVASEAMQPLPEATGPRSEDQDAGNDGLEQDGNDHAHVNALDAEATEQPAALGLRFQGLLNASELDRFFRKHHFARGYDAGFRFGDAEALSQGLGLITSAFQNILVNLRERKRAKFNRLQLSIVSTEPLSATVTAKLRLGARQIEEEMALLDEQILAANDHKGWVLAAINRYRLGFEHGLHTAMDSELLKD